MTKAEPRYWATCVVDGVFLPDRGQLISRDGHIYTAHQAKSHLHWSRRHPDDAMEARLHVCWPRTTADGVELTLVNSYLPTDPHCDHLEPLVNRVSISGVVTNQRASKGMFVMRIMRNNPAPKGKHTQSQFKPHLLFIHGLLQPLSAHLNHVVRLDCRLETGHLVLDAVASIGESLEEVLDVGGVLWPWPFLNNAASIKRLADLNAHADNPWIPLRSDYRETLATQLAGLEKKSRELAAKAANNRNLARDADRVRIISRRIQSICRFATDDDLKGLLRRTKLLPLLDSFKADLTTARKMTPPTPLAVVELKKKAPAKSQPKRKAVDLPEGLEQVADLLLRKYPDDLIALGCNYTALQVRNAVQQLVSCGWYDALSSAEQSKINSYQLKKVLKLRG